MRNRILFLSLCLSIVMSMSAATVTVDRIEPANWVLVIFCLSILEVVSSTYNPFIYFNF